MRPVTAGLLTILLGLIAPGARAHPPCADLTGMWRTQMHHALVSISACADSTPCGALVWVDPGLTQGVTTDARNLDPRLRNRPLIGLRILWGFRSEATQWASGRVYNPDTGQTFSASLRLLSEDTLLVTGCLGPLCRSERWIRQRPPQTETRT
jgi:uncharacterized protein (DUF2147 family)